MIKRFSLKAFVAVALLHLAGSICLIAAAVSRMKAYENGERFFWLTSLSWIWMPVPVSLVHHFHFGPAGYLYYLALPWSVAVGLCFGFIGPLFVSWRPR